VPYETKETEGGKVEVINSETKEVKAIHEPPDAKEKAERQLKLLNAIENDPTWKPTDG
jgi:hypothetical protein